MFFIVREKNRRRRRRRKKVTKKLLYANHYEIPTSPAGTYRSDPRQSACRRTNAPGISARWNVTPVTVVRVSRTDPAGPGTAPSCTRPAPGTLCRATAPLPAPNSDPLPL